jgi:phosphoglycolate phosphatase
MSVRNFEIEEIREEYGHLTLPKIVAFDLDKTIHDIIKIYENIVNDTRIFMGEKAWQDHEFREFHEDGFVSNEMSFKKMFPGKENVALAYYYDKFHASTVTRDKLIPGSSFMLHRFKKLYNLQIIGVTNSEQHMAKKAMRDLEIFGLFDSITGPKGNRKLKPETELLIIGLNKIAKSPGKDVWFLGDSATDTKCAREANCTSIRFYCEQEKPLDPYADAYSDCHFKYEKIVGTLLGFYPQKLFLNAAANIG